MIVSPPNRLYLPVNDKEELQLRRARVVRVTTRRQSARVTAMVSFHQHSCTRGSHSPLLYSLIGLCLLVEQKTLRSMGHVFSLSTEPVAPVVPDADPEEVLAMLEPASSTPLRPSDEEKRDILPSRVREKLDVCVLCLGSLFTLLPAQPCCRAARLDEKALWSDRVTNQWRGATPRKL